MRLPSVPLQPTHLYILFDINAQRPKINQLKDRVLELLLAHFTPATHLHLPLVLSGFLCALAREAHPLEEGLCHPHMQVNVLLL